MIIGTIFQANDKLGKSYTYRLDGINSSCKMRKYVLTNLNLNCITEVELEWFNQRKISIGTEDKNAIVTGSRIGENSLGSKLLYVEYTISKEYQKQNDLRYRNREFAIMMNRVKGDETIEKTSYAKMVKEH